MVEAYFVLLVGPHADPTNWTIMEPIRNPEGFITNTVELAQEQVVSERVLCPACGSRIQTITAWMGCPCRLKVLWGGRKNGAGPQNQL
jgi:hypothetical protein